MIEAGSIGRNQFPDARRKGRRFAHNLLREPLQMNRRADFEREHVQDLRILRSRLLHHPDSCAVVVVAFVVLYVGKEHVVHRHPSNRKNYGEYNTRAVPANV